MPEQPAFIKPKLVVLHTYPVQTFTLLCSHRMWATNASLEFRTQLHSPHVYPEPGGLLRSAEAFVFLSGGGEYFFCPLT